jgi:hypothetical protein
MLPEGTTRSDLLAKRQFREYAIQNAVSWYKFVNETLGREVRNGSLYLITGRDNATAYGVASFSDHDGTTESISASFFSVEDAGSPLPARKYAWHTQNSISHRAGSSDTRTQNQCIFLRGFRIALNESIFARFFGGLVLLSRIEEPPPPDFDRLDQSILAGTSTAIGIIERSSHSYGDGGRKAANYLAPAHDAVQIQPLPGQPHASSFFSLWNQVSNHTLPGPISPV